ncbi:MAG: EAL domain-containing protein [Gammaproteobacteria bacterium]|nr:EAL domain-containing protein [Gammaproteobacteria bacterium]
MHANLHKLDRPDTEPAEEIFIGRQPILDEEQQLCAFELLFRRDTQNRADVTDDMAATATVLTHVITELGIEVALGPYLGFINLDADMLSSDAIEMLPPDRFVLEVLETVTVTPQLIARCEVLKSRGYRIALDDFIAAEDRHAALLDLADIVKVEVKGMDAPAIRHAVEVLRPSGARLLAEKVDNLEQVELCRKLGFELFQGYYFAKPTILSGRKLAHSELTLIRLLGLILTEAETSELEAAFKQEPALVLNLMRLSNSAFFGLTQRTNSLRHAIMVLGRRQLQRWLQLLLFTSHSGAASPLLQIAATRGRLMELLTIELEGANLERSDRAFMAGILSLLPALLHMPLEEILAHFEIVPALRAALLAREGSLGRLLMFVELQEQGDETTCRKLAARIPGCSLGRANALLTQAMAWANGIGR